MFAGLQDWWRQERERRRFRARYFADVPVDLKAMPQYRGELFPTSGPEPWIDQPDALAILEQKLAAKAIDPLDAEICHGLIVDGYYIARNLIPTEVLDVAWQGYEEALEDGIVHVKPETHGEGDKFPGRLLDPHLGVPEVRDVMWRPEILRITDMLFGRPSIPFQTIIGHKSSHQAPHADAIHMTTYPPGYLLAAWIALEDIHPDSGPVVYYPGSHRLLPQLLSADVGIEKMEFKERPSVYHERYERQLQQRIDAAGVKAVPFCGKKGDVLFWHANLAHGGSRRTDLKHSRKALVCHYFAKGAFTYHDLSGNPSRLHRNGVYSELADDRPTTLGEASPEPRSLLHMLLKSKYFSLNRNIASSDNADSDQMRGLRMAKLAKKSPEATTSPDPHFGRVHTMPATIYEGSTRMIYRVWARGSANARMRVEVDGVTRLVAGMDSADVVGTKIIVSSKIGSVSCDYQFLGRDE
ncbi:MAG TPA: phytanoyl-CoA dioxygenase family protein [Reyranella sp.]|nr:phytanoyl-CoA dioxygenase family protein [Reyranella sp.]